jgi:Lysine-specific metallo-endopeptidase
LDPERLGFYFGGYHAPRIVRETIGRGSAIPLGLLAARMVSSLSKTKYIPAGEIQHPDVFAFVYNTDPLEKNNVYIGFNWWTLPTFPVKPQAMDWCKVGVVVHEFAHLTHSKIGDTRGKNSYGKGALEFPLFEALRNADNYRLAVQAINLE